MAGKSKKYSGILLESMPTNPTVEDMQERVKALFKHYNVEDSTWYKIYCSLEKNPSPQGYYIFKQETLIMILAKDLNIPAFLPENINNKIRKKAKEISNFIDFAIITTLINQKKVSITNAITDYISSNVCNSQKTFDAMKKQYERTRNSQIITQKFYNKDFQQHIANKLNLHFEIKEEYVKKIGDLCMEQIANNRKNYEDFAEYKNILKGHKRKNEVIENLIAEAIQHII